MNNRIMAALFALTLCLCLFIGVVPVDAEAAHTHSYVKHEAKAATCTLKGHEEYYECSGCHKLFDSVGANYEVVWGDVEKTALGHDWEDNHTATQHQQKCARAGCTATQNTHSPNPKKVDKGDGTHIITCWETGCTYKDEGAHRFDDKCTCVCGNVTHTSDNQLHTGASYSTHKSHWNLCTKCGAVMNEVEHKLEWVKTETTHEYVCACGANAFALSDHDFRNNLIVKNEDGTHTETCFYCGYEKTITCNDGETINCHCHCGRELEHDYSDYNKNADGHISICAVCDKQKPKDKWVPHNYADFKYVGVHSGIGYHSAVCSDCAFESPSDKLLACVDKDNDHECDDCGETVPHAFGAAYMKDVYGESVDCEKDRIKLYHKQCEVCDLRMIADGTVVTDADVYDYAKEHTYTWDQGKYNTTHHQWCTVCYHETEKEDHDFEYTSGLTVGGKPAHHLLCTECGYEGDVYCTPMEGDDSCFCICGYKFPHQKTDLTITAPKAATCETDGNYGYYTCDKCGDVFALIASTDWQKTEFTTASTMADTVIKALGHKWVWTSDNVNGTHAVKCDNCQITNAIEHWDDPEDDDCLCDVVDTNGVKVCNKRVHDHTPVHVARVEPTCVDAGMEAHYKFEACGKLFEDRFGNAPTTMEALAIPATGEHEYGDWVTEGDEHVKYCENCAVETERDEHVDVTGGDNRCDVCGVEIDLEFKAEIPATCTTAGKKAYYYSKITGRSYWDAEGTKYISRPADLIIDAFDHVDPVTGVGLVAENNGNGTHSMKCLLCNYVSNPQNHTTGGCFCAACGAGASGDHVATTYAFQAATCEKDGHEAYAKCSCGKYYNALGEEVTYQSLVRKSDGHTWGAEIFNDDASGKHFAKCEICNAKNYGEHKPTATDPLSGNYHQWICECGDVKLEMHYDKNGDNVCDEKGCKRELSGKEVTVNNNPSTTVVTGKPSNTNSTWSWLKNWLTNTTPSNGGGSSQPENTAQPGTSSGSGSQGSSSGNNVTPPSNGSNGSNGNGGSQNPGQNGNQNPSQGGNQNPEATGVLQYIISFFNWIFSGMR